MPKPKELNKRPPLSDTEVVIIFNLMYVFHIPYLDARACMKDGVAEKLISLWIDFEKKSREARGSTNIKEGIEDGNRPMD